MRKDRSSCEANPKLLFLMPSVITLQFSTTLAKNFYIMLFRDDDIV